MQDDKDDASAARLLIAQQEADTLWGLLNGLFTVVPAQDLQKWAQDAHQACDELMHETEPSETNSEAQTIAAARLRTLRTAAQRAQTAAQKAPTTAAPSVAPTQSRQG